MFVKSAVLKMPDVGGNNTTVVTTVALRRDDNTELDNTESFVVALQEDTVDLLNNVKYTGCDSSWWWWWWSVSAKVQNDYLRV